MEKKELLMSFSRRKSHVHLAKEGGAPPAHLMVAAPAVVPRIHLVAQLLEDLGVPLEPSSFYILLDR